MKMPIPSLDNLEFCNFAICWPDTQEWRAILIGLITTPGRGRFWDEKTGQITSVQEVGQQILEHNLPLEKSLMACTDDVAAALENIANALEHQASVSAACCAGGASGGAGSGGGGGEETPPSTTTEPDLSDPPPAGFDTWEDYFAYKCAVATQIWQDTFDDVGKISTFNLVVMATLGAVIGFAPLLAASFATPIPFDDIAAIATLVLTAYGLVATSIEQLEASLATAREDMICAIMGARSVGAAQVAWHSAWADGIQATASSSAIAAILEGIADKFDSNDSFNRIFDKDEERIYPSADCSYCNFGCEFEVFFGTGTPVLGSNFTMLSELDTNGWWYIHFEWNCGDGVCRNLNYETISVADAGTLGGGQVASCLSDPNPWHYTDGWQALRDAEGLVYHVYLVTSVQAELTVRIDEL